MNCEGCLFELPLVFSTMSVLSQFVGDGDGEGDEEFGPIMKFEELKKEAEARGVVLPMDMVEAAKTTGIRQSFLFLVFGFVGEILIFLILFS